MVFSSAYLYAGIFSLIFGVVGLAYVMTWLNTNRRLWRPSRAHRRSWGWIALLVTSIALICGGLWLIRVALPPNYYNRLQIQAVATTSGGEVYLITPQDNAFRCVVASECAELRPGTVVLYHYDKTSRNGIVDVRKE